MGVIKVGTASWADRMVIAAGWYPRGANTPAGRLAYYATRFPLVEVDTTFYALPAVETAAGWVDATPPGFTFNVKAFGLLTGHHTPVSALPAPLRPKTTRERIRHRDLAPEALDEVWRRFHAVLEPLVSAGKLGAVLFQYPPWLVRGDAARRRILEAAERCAPLRIAVELRHSSWYDGDGGLEVLEFLARNGITYCGVDGPQGHPSSVPPVLAATTELAMVRFHGHSESWAERDKKEKYRYHYTGDELADWVPRLRALAGDADELHLLFNNCCGDQSQRDAAALADLLGVAPPPVPPQRTPRSDALFP